ncbi:MAG: arylamine N-acetyltransferase [Clostridiales Family XIII bacterium]|jgi:N-hydroxyarylamine O-acetyltransferase|nr:arylamine N-acetyltransferase [Clostridiales Family XIII bacterium]
MYRKLDESLRAEEVRAYLERIGLRRPAAADRAALDAIIFAHQCSVPFENLDSAEYRTAPHLETSRLFDKIVRRRRGGWCFELNSLFASLLKALGYSVTAHFARVYHGDEFMTKPLHRVNLVQIGGASLYCDVGFGGTTPSASLVVEDGLRQEIRGEVFFFKPCTARWISLCTEANGAALPLLTFDRESAIAVDFTVPNAFGASANIRFRDTRIVKLRRPDGKLSLEGNTLTKLAGETMETRTFLTKRELYNALAEAFGIELELDSEHSPSS